MTSIISNNSAAGFQTDLLKVFNLARAGDDTYIQVLSSLDAPQGFQLKILEDIHSFGADMAYKMACQEGVLTDHATIGLIGTTSQDTLTKAGLPEEITDKNSFSLSDVKDISEIDNSLKTENKNLEDKMNIPEAPLLFENGSKIPPIPEVSIRQVRYNPLRSEAEMRREYNKLGHLKWLEAVDGIHSIYGALVYDEGLHGGMKEPGFMLGVANCFKKITNHLGEEITADYFLSLHKVLCAHMKGQSGVTHMNSERIGAFRTKGDITSWKVRGVYEMTEEAIEEFNQIEPSLGEFIKLPNGEYLLLYREMSEDEVRAYYNLFLSDLKSELEAAGFDSDKRITAVARFIQRTQWLHSVHDGCGRTDTALMNEILTVVGFHPAILKLPYLSSTLPLRHWKQFLIQGLLDWEDIARQFES
jgi:hypothetical protein